MTRRLFLLFALLPACMFAQTPFSGDSALANLTVLSQRIGPRPMGSPAERRALAYALQKFHVYGLSEVYLMPVSEYENEFSHRPTNTASGIAVGVLQGESDSMIVIGGHIDSAGPEIPGANDDGSGSATVIELARVLSQRKHHATLVFCCFGGEEQGLRGSGAFVRTFPHLDRVRLMLQIDMTNGGWLLPLIDNGDRSAPRWLVSALYEEFHRLGYRKLSYPTHFLSMSNAMPGGGIGSDHMPFLERNIPAIDLTSDINDPIHTQQDELSRFDATGLKRSGDVIYRLVERFDAGQPVERNERYMLVEFFGSPVFLTPLLLIAGIVVSLGVAAAALLVVRRRRSETDRTSRPRIPALKLFLLMLVIQTFVWLSEDIVSIIKGVRYPWFADQNGYFILGGIAGILGIWVALQISPALKLSRDPYRWFLRAAVWLTVLTVLFAFAGARLAFYPAFGLLCLALAMLVRIPPLQVLLWLASPHLMIRLVLNEGFPLFSRSMQLGGQSPGVMQSLIMHLLFILFFSLWAFPFLLGFAAVVTDIRRDVLRLGAFRSRIGLALAGGATIVCVIVLCLLPSYSADWPTNVRVDELITLPERSLRVSLQSPEYLSGCRVTVDGRDTLITGRTTDALLLQRSGADSGWITVQRTLTPRQDATGGADLRVSLGFRERPYTLSVTYAGPERALRNAATTFSATTTDRSLSLKWYSFPDSEMTLPVHFAAAPDSVIETIEATFVQPAVRVAVDRPLTNVITRTVVRRTETLHAPF